MPTKVAMSWQLCICAGLMFAFVGCGSKGSGLAIEESNLRKIIAQYGPFMGRHSGAPPANEAELKEFMRKNPEIKNVDALFISERDKKPYVITYGPVAPGEGPAGMPVIAYEQEGVNGKRFVASTLAVEEVDAEKFKKWVPNPK